MHSTAEVAIEYCFQEDPLGLPILDYLEFAAVVAIVIELKFKVD
jgi:hypothetical protein